MAFAEPLRAAAWCADVQRQLLDVDWPPAVLACEPAAEVLGHDASDRPIFRGLCVRMGMHAGRARAAVDRVTRRPEYRGTIAEETLRIVGRAQPGQVILSAAAAAAVRDGPEPVRLAGESRHRGTGHQECIGDGAHEGEDQEGAGDLYELRPRGLEGRLFGEEEEDEGATARAVPALCRATTTARATAAAPT